MICRNYNLFVYWVKYIPLILPGEVDKEDNMIVKYHRVLIDNGQ